MYDLMTIDQLVDSMIEGGDFNGATTLIRECSPALEEPRAWYDRILMAELAFKEVEWGAVTQLHTDSTSAALHAVHESLLPAAQRTLLLQRVHGYNIGPCYYHEAWTIAYLADGARVIGWEANGI